MAGTQPAKATGEAMATLSEELCLEWEDESWGKGSCQGERRFKVSQGVDIREDFWDQEMMVILMAAYGLENG